MGEVGFVYNFIRRTFEESAQNLTLAVSEILGWVKSLAVIHNTLMDTHSGSDPCVDQAECAWLFAPPTL